MTFDGDRVSVDDADAAASTAHRGRRTWQVTDDVVGWGCVELHSIWVIACDPGLCDGQDMEIVTRGVYSPQLSQINKVYAGIRFEVKIKARDKLFNLFLCLKIVYNEIQ